MVKTPTVSRIMFEGMGVPMPTSLPIATARLFRRMYEEMELRLPDRKR
jgi:hypothetical protein